MQSELAENDNAPVTCVFTTTKPSGYEFEQQYLPDLYQGWLSVVDAHVIDKRESQISNALLNTCHLAFAQHCPLQISPDVIWYTIIQGLIRHLTINNDVYNNRIGLNHEGKQQINIKCNHFSPNVAENDWNSIMQEFADEISKCIGTENVKLVQPGPFTTTKPCHTMALNVAVMDMAKDGFEYVVETMCGIPEFKVMGTPNDWRMMRAHVQKFREFDLEAWIDDLEQIIDTFTNIVSNVESTEPLKLNNLYKYKEQSGGGVVDGDITKLFPYMRISDYSDEYKYMYDYSGKRIKDMHCNTSRFPCNESEAHFKWKLGVHEKDMVVYTNHLASQKPQDGTLYVITVNQVTEAHESDHN